MPKLWKMISHCLNDGCLIEVSKLLSIISAYDNYISYSINQICSGHNCLVIPVSPQFPDADFFKAKSFYIWYRAASNKLWSDAFWDIKASCGACLSSVGGKLQYMNLVFLSKAEWQRFDSSLEVVDEQAVAPAGCSRIWVPEANKSAGVSIEDVDMNADKDWTDDGGGAGTGEADKNRVLANRVEIGATKGNKVEVMECTGVWSRKVGIVAGTGCVAWVVVLRAGANASASIILCLSGQIPDFWDAHSIVPGVNTLLHACE